MKFYSANINWDIFFLFEQRKSCINEWKGFEYFLRYILVRNFVQCKLCFIRQTCLEFGSLDQNIVKYFTPAKPPLAILSCSTEKST